MAAEIGNTYGKRTSILGISSTWAKYRPKEGVRGATHGRATRDPGYLVVALWPHTGNSGSFRHADFLSDFSGIFGGILIIGKPEIEKQQKIETGTGVH